MSTTGLELLLFVLGLASTASLTLAGWTLRSAHDLAVRVAVLEGEGRHAASGNAELREQLEAVEVRITGRVTALEEHLGRRIDALALAVVRGDGRPASDG